MHSTNDAPARYYKTDSKGSKVRETGSRNKGLHFTAQRRGMARQIEMAAPGHDKKEETQEERKMGP
jgi:hypothetical protein